ncbi:MAG: dihydroneopterin aldolase [Sphingobacteriales bacterium]|nr:MAG: dihydroneopterin aldolase [Sphingobacteriales bacterium]
MMIVLLQGAEFYAYHGYYPQEQLLGCRFIIDLAVTFDPQDTPVSDDLGNTVNYEQLHNICSIEMKNPRKLIETVGNAIVDKIKSSYPFVQNIELTLKKLHPPMKGSVGNSGVIINYSKP